MGKNKIIFLLQQTELYALFCGVLFLPIYQTINHWFLGIFIASSVVLFLYSGKKIEGKINGVLVPLLIGCFSLFIIRLVSLIYAPDLSAASVKLIRSLPFLLYPLGVLSITANKNISKASFEKKIFWCLAIGCTITAILSWGNIIINMEQNPIPASKMFGWKKSGGYLTAFLDLHPPYLGMLFCGAIVFLFREAFFNPLISKLKKGFIYVWIIFLIIFLFNLTARNSLFYILGVGLFFFIIKKQWKFILVFSLLCFTAITLIIKHPSEYYRLKMYHMLGLSSKKEVEDTRFKRLQASYNVFKMSPVFGVGIGVDTELKVQQYIILNHETAAMKKQNSHNQFFEYLAAYGILGGLIFIVAIIYFLSFLIKNGYYFYLILFLNVFFASISESIFERAIGVQYYSLIVSAIIFKKINYKKETVSHDKNFGEV